MYMNHTATIMSTKICVSYVMHIMMWFLFRLAKAEDNHQIAIAEKLDLEARLNEEKQISKVFKLACLLHAHVQTNKFFVLFYRDMMLI